MGYVHQDLVSPLHWYQVMNNAVAGGAITFNGTDVTVANATGGFGYSTGNASTGAFTWTGDYSGTPAIVVNVLGSASGQTNILAKPFGMASASVGIRFQNSTGGTANATANVFMFGAGTGTRHS